MNGLWLVALLLLAVSPRPAQAAEMSTVLASERTQGAPVRPEPRPDRGPRGPSTQDGQGTSPVAQAIADHFQVSLDAVIGLRARGLGFGEIARIYFVSQEGAGTADEIAAALLADPGHGWGDFIKSKGLQPGGKGRNLGLIMRATRGPRVARTP